MGTLLDKIIAAAPQAILVVAQVVPITDNDRDKAFAPAYHALIPAVVEQRAKDGKHIILVDQFTTFNVSTMMSPDNIHPNQTGYDRMGDVWYAAVKSALN